MKFSTIIADPPWPYSSRMRANEILMQSVPFDEYETMTIEEISSLPFHKFTNKDAHLYLWTTQSFMRDAFTVMDAWGFKHGATLIWSKSPKGICGTYVCSAEFVLFGRRGHLPHKRRQLGTVFEWPRSAHSSKPEAFVDLVESVSPGPYLELFARRNRLGWSTWGNECLEHIKIDV